MSRPMLRPPERWLATRGEELRDTERAACERDRAEERLFRALLLGARAELLATYAGSEPDAEKLARKRAILARLGAEVSAALDDGRLGARYAPWRSRAWNNADLAAVADYTLWVPALKELFAQSGGFAELYAAARALAKLPADERERRLATLNPGTDERDRR